MAALLEITWEADGGAVRLISFDASVSEQHESGADVTEHPVESGANVSDHVRPQLDRISVEAIVTNTPLDVPRSHMDGVGGGVRSVDLDLGDRRVMVEGARVSATGSVTEARYEDQPTKQGASVLQFDGPFDRVRSVYDELRGLVRSGQVVEIVTGLREYESMVLRSLGAPRSAASGDAITFRLEAVQIRRPESQVLAEPLPVEPRGRKEDNQGNQPTGEDEPGLASLGAQGLDGGLEALGRMFGGGG